MGGVAPQYSKSARLFKVLAVACLTRIKGAIFLTNDCWQWSSEDLIDSSLIGTAITNSLPWRLFRQGEWTTWSTSFFDVTCLLWNHSENTSSVCVYRMSSASTVPYNLQVLVSRQKISLLVAKCRLRHLLKMAAFDRLANQTFFSDVCLLSFCTFVSIPPYYYVCIFYCDDTFFWHGLLGSIKPDEKLFGCYVWTNC
jgi:hypothetical protein